MQLSGGLDNKIYNYFEEMHEIIDPSIKGGVAKEILNESTWT